MNLLLFLSGGCWVRLKVNGASPSPQAGLASWGNPLRLLAKVFGHQAPQRCYPMMLCRSGAAAAPARLVA